MKKQLVLLAAVAVLMLSGCESVFGGRDAKPVIYLYPEEETAVTVGLDYGGTLTCTYPAAQDGVWTVTASPDGTLRDEEGQEYSYLFWEGTCAASYDFPKGSAFPARIPRHFWRRPSPPWGSIAGRPMNLSSTGCPRWSKTPIISSPSRQRRTPTTPGWRSPPGPTASCGCLWPGRPWTSRWNFLPKPCPPLPAQALPWSSGAAQTVHNPRLIKEGPTCPTRPSSCWISAASITS